MPTRLARAGLLLAAWLPFLLLWIVFAMLMGHESLALATLRALLTIGSAALLALPVARFCRAVQWPNELRSTFLLTHLGAAALYAVAWSVSAACADVLLTTRSFRQGMLFSPVIGWMFLMGVWLYGVIAGICYAMTMQREAHAIQLRAVRAEAGLAAARLQAVRNRLHPHFLFNALHTIGALSRQDAARTEEAVEKLGAMLRYALREDRGGDLVPFAEEWEFTRRYIEFEQLRYEERLQVSAEIDPGVLACGAPAFALQTLVENAMRHSIAPRPEGGRIEIVARREGTRFHLRVRDDGHGEAESEPGLRSGLRALRERLEAAYAGEAVLATESGAGGYVVSLTMPLLDADGDVDG